MENVENLILEHLKSLRSGQDRIEHELKEVKGRLTSLESNFASGEKRYGFAAGRYLPSTSEY